MSKNNNNQIIYMILGILAIAFFVSYPSMNTQSQNFKGSVNAEAQKETVKEPTLEELALEKEKQAKELAEKERLLAIEKAVNAKEKEILDLKKSASQSAVDTGEEAKKE